MGVWIETFFGANKQDKNASHPVWVCGLKLHNYNILNETIESHPVWVCGLKRKGEWRS